MTSTSAAKPDRLKEAHDKLTAAVESIISSDDWQRMLKVASKFHRYSFNNHLMIFCQRPDATLVAGFRRWLELGRYVRKGEKGIAIFAPGKYKVDPSSDGPAAASSDGEEQEQKKVIKGFRVVYVFDISQTEGEDLPDLDAVRPKLLDGDAPEGIWDALVVQANAAGFKVIRDRRGSENGMCDFTARVISVAPGLTELQATKTLIHELSHALLHSEDRLSSREVAEVEVESAAFVVLDALGLDSGTYSFPYVARWASGDMDLIQKTGKRVVDCSSRILAGLETTPDEVSNLTSEEVS